MKCTLCNVENEEESETHLMKCTEIVKEINKDINVATASYADIFSDDIDDQLNITQIFDNILKIKNAHQRK